MAYVKSKMRTMGMRGKKRDVIGELREERDAHIRTNEELSKSYRELQAECERAESALAEARLKLDEALSRSGNRWEEWGERAEDTAGLLDELREILQAKP